MYRVRAAVGKGSHGLGISGLGSAPVEQLQQRGDEDVDRVRVLVDQEAEAAEEVDIG